MKIGLFGGTFNPVHSGHVNLVKNFKEKLNLDKVLVIPTATPPHKEAKELASSEDRIEMCKLAFGDLAEVSDVEIRRGGKSYTVETLEELKKIYKNDDFYFLVGSDMLLSFKRWYRWQDILSMCTLCATDRNNEESCKEADEEFFKSIIFCDFDKIVISSSEVREKIEKGEDVSDFLQKEVYDFIKEKGLYMLDTQRNEEFKELIKVRLKENRYVHSLNVADSAKYLAGKYGCSEEKAYTAGLLHDVMKNASDEEQLLFIEKAGMSLTPCEKHNKKLWHAVAGTAFMKTDLNIKDEDIINAVRYHTTARENMSVLEKVIYVADFISADRNYPGVDEVRQAAEESLEKAMMIGLEFCIHEIVEKKQILHPDSVDAYNEIIISNPEVLK